MANGKIGVTSENIFPVIKKFLYSDHDIFLRELVANAVDATQKVKALAASGELKGELGDITINIAVDTEKKVITISDNGIGMTSEEVEKYINQIAFSSAGEFLEKYKDTIGSIIGHFGLGFYSSFMVSKRVTIDTLSWKDGAESVLWECEGDPEYKMALGSRNTRGTTITLYLDDESEDFASEAKIEALLNKFCKFMPVPIAFGMEKEWKDGKYEQTGEPHIVNNCAPIWTSKPSDLNDEDYLKFYQELYPMQDEPLFHIHLNVDYPFNLTGILYFPKVKDKLELSRNKIQLFCNQMFVTDSVENIVPEFMTLLHGVIDSPDIPLNVSRSYLQSDANVKKISSYITKKVADKLDEISRDNKEEFESKWDNLKLFIEYGMITDEKFAEKAMNFTLLKNTDNKYFSLDDYRKVIEAEQTNKDGKVVYLYTTNQIEQYQYVEAAKNKGYDVLVMDCPLDAHFVAMLEHKIENSIFSRVDADVLDKIIVKEDIKSYEMSEEEKNHLKEVFNSILPSENRYEVAMENLGVTSAPIIITQSEFMRRYREMAAIGGGMNFYGEIPTTYNITINAENPIIEKIKKSEGGISADNKLLLQVTDLALLSNNMLKGKALSDFIQRSQELL